MKTSFPQRPTGFTIVELMVSLTIGLIVTWAVTSLFTATFRTFKSQDSSARSQEVGRYAISLLGQHIRQAGFFELTGIENITSFSDFVAKQTAQGSALNAVPSLKGCRGRITFNGPGWPCVGSDTQPDSLLVAYQVQSTPSAVTKKIYNLLPFDANGNTAVGSDCLGQDTNATGASPKGLVAVSYFYVDTTVNRLMCRGNGSATANSVADGVEDMRILYGVNEAPLTSTSPIRYVAASAVANWTQVQSIRLCIQVQSTQVVQATNTEAKARVNYAEMTGQNCRGVEWSQAGYDDGILRKAYWATISVRNQSPRVPL